MSHDTDSRNPRNNVRNTPKKKQVNWQLELVDIRVTGGDLDTVQELLEASDLHVGVMLEDFLNFGYKVSVGTDANGGGGICTVSCPTDYVSDPNAGQMYISRAGTPKGALLVAWYKMFRMCTEYVWTSAGQRVNSSNRPTIS